MIRYVALVEYDRDAAAFGLSIPDCPGCTAMGGSFDDVEASGIEALREWAADYRADGAELPRPRDIIALRSDPSLIDDFGPNTIAVSVPVYLDAGRPMRVNVSMEAGLVAEIDEAARRRGLTRSGFLASAARDKIAGDRAMAAPAK